MVTRISPSGSTRIGSDLLPDSSTVDKLYYWLAGLLILLSLPARFVRLKDSVWLDESWVVNSLLPPTLHDIFYSKNWAQSTPPLFLLLERWMIGLFGYAEPVFRVVPVVACLVGTVLAAAALRRWLSTWAALIAFTLICSNYYLLKYSQQVKQYGSDFLVSVVLLLLVGRYLENRSQRAFVAVLVAGVFGIFLSYTAAFWLPTLFIALSLPGPREAAKPAGPGRIPWGRMATAGCVLGAAFLLLNFIFIRPNRTEALVASFEYPSLHRPLWSLHRVISTIGMTLTTRRGAVADIAGTVAVAVAAYLVVSAIMRLRTAGLGEERDLMLVLAGALPPLLCIAAGFMRLYPMIDFPRMWLFALPSAALLLGASADIVLSWISRDEAHPVAVPVIVAAACVAVVLANQFILIRYPNPTEENRPAIAFIKSHMDSQDVLFVHGWLFEQFKYYRTLLGLQPEHLYVGNEGWPCCPLEEDNNAISSPALTDFHSDLLEAARRAKGHDLWMLYPAALEGTWESYMRSELEKFPAVLEEGGCHRESRNLYGLTLVESYSCR